MKSCWAILILAWANLALADISFESFKTLPNGLGTNIHFTHPKKGELEQLAAAGFKFVRMDLRWNETEKDDGSYDFSSYDHLMRELDKHQIRAILILDYIHPKHDDNQSVHTDAGRAAFARWSVAA